MLYVIHSVFIWTGQFDGKQIFEAMVGTKTILKKMVRTWISGWGGQKEKPFTNDHIGKEYSLFLEWDKELELKRRLTSGWHETKLEK